MDLAAYGWELAYVEEVVAHHHPSPARDHRARQALAARNTVLTAVLRRPWPVVARPVLRTARSGRPGRQGLRDAVPRLPRALARRRPSPAPWRTPVNCWNALLSGWIQVLESIPTASTTGPTQ
ncbi:hypothetical protein AB0G06_40475 [Nonomuraea dietziae]